MRYIELAKSVAYAYKANVKEAEHMERCRSSPEHEIRTFTKGRISNPTQAAAIRLDDDRRYQYIKQSIEAVEYAIDRVRQLPNGETTVHIFEMVYYNATHRLYGAAMVEHISEPTAWRYNAYFIRLIGIRMGYIPTK